MFINRAVPFANAVFNEVYGSLVDEYGNSYVEVYEYEITELVLDMCQYLEYIVQFFGKFTDDDVAKIFVICFWDTESMIGHNINMNNIVHTFTSIYSDDIMGLADI